MQNKEKEHLDKADEKKPPLFSSWSGWYKLLIFALIGWIIILYLITAYYS